ncbi:Uncharacterized protein FWK35_00024202, partial [Aphis craccivora]
QEFNCNSEKKEMVVPSVNCTICSLTASGTSVMSDHYSSIHNIVMQNTHVGHLNDLGKLPFDKVTRDNIAILHKNDALSVDSWVQTVRSDDKFSLVYYKPQDNIDPLFPNLKKEDFVLIIMNNYQKSMLEKFGNDVISIDDTHGMNSYHFNLTTILVLDDMREGFPCVSMISNRVDEAVLKILFSQIRALTGPIEPKVFMSDMAEYRAWRKNLTKVKPKEKQAEVYKIIRTLLHEKDTKAFENIFVSAISQISVDEQTNEFANYFVSHYGNCVQSWAMGILPSNSCWNRLIVIHKGKITSKIKELRKRHKHSLEMSHEMVLKATEDSWDIVSEKHSEMYRVNRLKTFCDCQIQCQDCLSCIHFCRFQYNQENNGTSTNCLAVDNHMYNVPNSNTEDEHDNETSNIVCQLNNSTITSQHSLELEKGKVQESFNKMLNEMSTFEELNVLKKYFLPIIPTLTTIRNKSNTTNLKSKTSQSSPTNKKIIP